MKKCRACCIEKDSSDFSKRKINADGLYSYCKQCTSEKAKVTREKFLEKRLANSRKYKEKNKEFLKEKSRKYYQRNQEKILEKAAKYRRVRKKEISIKEALRRLADSDRFEKNRNKHKKWSSSNRERLNEYQRDWYQKNKEKRRSHVILNRSIISGELVRPDICSQCFKKCKPDGHHEDYSKPLSVEWLCKICHARMSPRTVLK